MDKCKCGARRCYTEHRPGMAKAGFDCGTYISHQGAERYSRECLFTQLAAANEKLAESARLATESAQLADGLAKDLAAANDRNAGWEKAAESWFASPEAAQRLEGYREVALKVNAAELALAAANERAGRLEAQMVELREAWPSFEYVDDTEGMVAVEVPEVVIQNFHRILGGS